jgi:hypothetical protein
VVLFLSGRGIHYLFLIDSGLGVVLHDIHCPQQNFLRDIPIVGNSFDKVDCPVVGF